MLTRAKYDGIFININLTKIERFLIHEFSIILQLGSRNQFWIFIATEVQNFNITNVYSHI